MICLWCDINQQFNLLSKVAYGWLSAQTSWGSLALSLPRDLSSAAEASVISWLATPLSPSPFRTSCSQSPGPTQASFPGSECKTDLSPTLRTQPSCPSEHLGGEWTDSYSWTVSSFHQQNDYSASPPFTRSNSGIPVYSREPLSEWSPGSRRVGTKISSANLRSAYCSLTASLCLETQTPRHSLENHSVQHLIATQCLCLSSWCPFRSDKQREVYPFITCFLYNE